MPSLFRRKSAEVSTAATDDEPTVDEPTGNGVAVDSASARRKGYTPSKRERGLVTPKRPKGQVRRAADTAPTSRREAYRQSRERARAERAEQREGMMRGDDRYLLPRDRGPERALVRDIVDSRRTAGTWFFGGALLVIIGSSGGMPPTVQLVSNLLWALLALAVIVDSVLISRRVGKLVRERFPKTDQRMGSLYLYAVMRAISFRRIRMPKPRVAIGDKV